MYLVVIRRSTGPIQLVSLCICPSYPYLTYSTYFLPCSSRLSPASYDLGSEKYEENVIIDCFGRERLEEYRGKGKLDGPPVRSLEMS